MFEDFVNEDKNEACETRESKGWRVEDSVAVEDDDGVVAVVFVVAVISDDELNWF